MQAYQSWGRYPKVSSQKISPLFWRHEVPDLQKVDGTVLGYGYGRSYGDSCLNDSGMLLACAGLNRFISFNPSTGVLKCEAGVSLANIIELILPQGWFLPVTPGTKFVSVAGAIANDVHGKNHHNAGTFGRFVRCFELLRSNGQRILCSPSENAEWFKATIGGLGLTGLITWAEIQLKKVEGPWIDQEALRFGNLEEFFEVNEESNRQFEYTVAWVDCLARGGALGRGIYFRGRHSKAKEKWKMPKPGLRRVPFDFPNLALSKPSVGLFNFGIYHSQWGKVKRGTVLFEPFFYPLDSILEWNRIYGKRGFFQHQCVLPGPPAREAIRILMEKITQSGLGSFLVVLKTFGDLASPGMLSFPREGVTLAMDFAHQGKKTLDLLDQLDEIVRHYGGAVYPAKDARMSADQFKSSFPVWEKFAAFVDPKFSSSFWRRVTAKA